MYSSWLCTILQCSFGVENMVTFALIYKKLESRFLFAFSPFSTGTRFYFNKSVLISLFGFGKLLLSTNPVLILAC